MLGKLFLCNILAMSSLCAGKDQLPGARLCTSKPGISWDSSDVHVVFIGDSLTRYQFLATTYRIHFQKTIPRSLVNEKMFDSWSDFYRKTTTIFSGSMKCDCFRYERGERKKKFTFSFSRENRFFSFSLHCKHSPPQRFLFTFIQYFGDVPSLHGRIFPSSIKEARPSKRQKKSIWSYDNLSSALKNFVGQMQKTPTHIVINVGCWPHIKVMQELKSAMLIANNLTSKVYWKETSPSKAYALSSGNSSRKYPKDIDKLAKQYCKSFKLCKYIKFPSTIPSHLLTDDENIPEYLDNIHFSSPYLYVFWSKKLFKEMDLNILDELL